MAGRTGVAQLPGKKDIGRRRTWPLVPLADNPVPGHGGAVSALIAALRRSERDIAATLVRGPVSVVLLAPDADREEDETGDRDGPDDEE